MDEQPHVLLRSVSRKTPELCPSNKVPLDMIMDWGTASEISCMKIHMSHCRSAFACHYIIRIRIRVPCSLGNASILTTHLISFAGLLVRITF